MKRIITCPKCEAKLSVFDLGKPINQKCPKCNNAFVVESDEKSAGAAEEGAAKKDAAVPADGAEKKSDAPPPSAPAADKKEDGADKKEDAAPKKPPESPAAVKPAASAPLPDAPVPHEEKAAGGNSFRFSATVVGLLILLAIMQVMAKKQSDRQYAKVMEHLKYIETQLPAGK